MDVRLCQYMLCSHGVFPWDLLRRPLKERLVMWELVQKEAKEVKRK